jgi:hypothetical protein
MSKKKVFPLRINEELFLAIEKWAADEFRSSNGQIEWILTRVMKEAGRLPRNGPKQKYPQGPEKQEE